MFLQHILFPKIKESKKAQSEKEEVSFEDKMKLYFEKLQWKSDELTSQKFFRKYNVGLRKILLHEGLKEAETATLKEIKKHAKILKSPVFEIFVKSYEYEYSWKEKTPATRKKYIEKITDLLSE